MFNYKEYQIKLTCGATDMRKSINGLSDIILTNFEFNPNENIIFAFCNKARNRIKLLVWEDNGFWVHFKRIEKGTIPWPEEIHGENIMYFDYLELFTLIKSNGLKQKIKRQEVWKKASE